MKSECTARRCLCKAARRRFQHFPLRTVLSTRRGVWKKCLYDARPRQPLPADSHRPGSPCAGSPEVRARRLETCWPGSAARRLTVGSMPRCRSRRASSRRCRASLREISGYTPKARSRSFFPGPLLGNRYLISRQTLFIELSSACALEQPSVERYRTRMADADGTRTRAPRRDRPVWRLASMSEEERVPHESGIYPIFIGVRTYPVSAGH
jgi:hypothetical protein